MFKTCFLVYETNQNELIKRTKMRHFLIKKRDKNVTSKKVKEVAKILVKEGNTLKETSEQLSVNIRLYNDTKNDKRQLKK